VTIIGGVMDAVNQHDRGFANSGWKRSSRCGPDGGDCVEVDLRHARKVAVRRSTRISTTSNALLLFDREEWATFVQSTRDGQFRGKSMTP
jgi:hypothetical protein